MADNYDIHKSMNRRITTLTVVIAGFAVMFLLFAISQAGSQRRVAALESRIEGLENKLGMIAQFFGKPSTESAAPAQPAAPASVTPATDATASDAAPAATTPSATTPPADTAPVPTGDAPAAQRMPPEIPQAAPVVPGASDKQ